MHFKKLQMCEAASSPTARLTSRRASLTSEAALVVTCRVGSEGLMQAEGKGVEGERESEAKGRRSKGRQARRNEARKALQRMEWEGVRGAMGGGRAGGGGIERRHGRPGRGGEGKQYRCEVRTSVAAMKA